MLTDRRPLIERLGEVIDELAEGIVSKFTGSTDEQTLRVLRAIHRDLGGSPVSRIPFSVSGATTPKTLTQTSNDIIVPGRPDKKIVIETFLFQPAMLSLLSVRESVESGIVNDLLEDIVLDPLQLLNVTGQPLFTTNATGTDLLLLLQHSDTLSPGSNSGRYNLYGYYE